MNDKKIKPRLDSEISTKEKYNTLKGKKKLEFIFDYYKLPIFGTIAAIIIVCYIGYSMYTKQDTYCNLTYLSSNMDTSQLTELKDTLNEKLLDDNKKNSIFIDSMTIDPNSNYGDDPTTTQAFAVKLAANEIDLLFLNENYFNHFTSNNMLADLTTLDGFNSLSFSKDDLVRSKDSDGNEHIYGLKVDKLNLLDNISFPENTILTVAISSERTEEAIKILNEFVK